MGRRVPGRGTATNVERVFREAYGPAVATLVQVFGDITLAEDAVQDAFVVASERWPADGIPPNPAGWIVTTARRRAVDVLRRSTRGRELYEQIARETPTAGDESPQETDLMADDQLRLIFTCCHPALRTEHQTALTLRLLGGLSSEEVARSFLVSEAAMAKRLVRAKYKIKVAGIPYRVPAAADLPGRLQAVLSVLYLIYNTGADDPDRAVLRGDGIRLAQSLAELMPDEPEAGDCWRWCCSTRPACRRAWRTASSCSCGTRIGHAGIGHSSTRGTPSCTPVSGATGPVLTSCKPLSRQCTATPPRSTRPIGHRS